MRIDGTKECVLQESQNDPVDAGAPGELAELEALAYQVQLVVERPKLVCIRRLQKLRCVRWKPNRPELAFKTLGGHISRRMHTSLGPSTTS